MITQTTTIENVLERLEQVKQTSSNKWRARCPAPGHDDKKPSLDIALGDDGKILFDCKSNHCSFSEICKGLELSESSMFPGRNGDGAIVATYDYRNEKGDIIYKVCKTSNKEFPICSPNGKWGLNGAKKVLYRLQELLKSDAKKCVFITEGEKDVDSLRTRLNATATTSPFGAGKWNSDYNIYLKDRKVCIIPDNDPQGKEHALQVAKSLYGTAKEIRIIELPNMPKGGDISDWLSAGGTREQFTILLKQAKIYRPEQEDDNIEPILVSLGTVKEEQVEWLWPERIPQGKIPLLVGDPGLGKSFFSLYLAAKVTTGSPWPDIPDTNIPIGSVVILSAEDDINDTILPRLNAAGANINKIIAIQGVKHKDQKNKQYFDLTKHIPQLEKAIKTMLDVKLIIIDPLSAYLGATDSHKNSEVRGCLGPLAEMAAKHKVAVLGISHLTKNTAVKSVYRVLGSVAFLAAARAVWAVAKDKDDPNRRLICPIKTNLSVSPTSMAFKIVDGAVAVESGIIKMTAEDILGDDTSEKSTLRYAIDWLRDTIKDEPLSTTDIYKMGKVEGLTIRTLQRAANNLDVKRIKVGFGKEGITKWSI